MSRDMILFDGFKKAIVFIFLVALVFGAGYMTKSCTIKKEIVKPETRTNIPSEPYIESDTVTGIKAEVIDETVYPDNMSDKVSQYPENKYEKVYYPDNLGIDNTETEKEINSEVSIDKLEVQGKKDPVDYLKYYRNRIARTDNIELKNGVTIGSILFRYRDETFHLYDVRYKKRSSSVEYRHPFFEFGSEIGYLTGTNGKYLLCSPVGVYVWRIGIKPTVMVGEDLSASYGIILGVRWMP